MLRFADPDERYAAVRLCSDLPPRDYERHDDEWRLELSEPPVARLEYKLELIHADGGSEWVLDPSNPHRAPGAFGEKSELQLEGYEPPGWLGEEGVPGRYDEVAPDVRVWAPEDAVADEELPLLVAHDGPEYDALSRLTHFLAVSIARGTLPRLSILVTELIGHALLVGLPVALLAHRSATANKDSAMPEPRSA